MDKKFTGTFLRRALSYILVAALASAATWLAADKLPNSKLERLAFAIDHKFIGEADQTKIQDAAAEAMIAALGDRWSYYVSAEEYAAHRERQKNTYVGIGVTVQLDQEGKGIEVVSVIGDGPAEKAGVLAGDIFTHADGVSLADLTLSEGKALIMGEKNTKVELTILRGEEVLDVTVTRKEIHSKTAEGQMLAGNIGYVRIDNFHGGAGEETVAEIEKLLEQGAEKLIFDIRNNPGGYVHETVYVLDYLLPEGPLFRSVNYNGVEDVDESDADCLQLPMAVLMNGNSYSAAEFFAAALWEYDWAVTVGAPTCGKGYYQTTVELGDGSAVQLSTGAYTTPNGVNLTEAGGLKPDIPVDPAQTAVTLADDPQVLAAIQALTE
ncbi:MAG: PDZ domain-containing protein [Oscillospiraceae bacterium]|nr:PDZ domain-containing protein [Oscillospiraceae bacterium]